MGSNALYGLVNQALHGSRDMRSSVTKDLAERPNSIPEVVSQETNRNSQLFPVSKNPHTTAAAAAATTFGIIFNRRRLNVSAVR